MNNTIILQKGNCRLTKEEYQGFEKGDTIMGNDSSPEEIARWNIEEKEDARKALENYKCKYKDNQEHVVITEYGLEYCECDAEGEFIQGSDYELAEEETKVLYRDNDVIAETLEAAKEYIYPADECNEEDYLGDDYQEYKKCLEEYRKDILNAKSLDELADIWNRNTDRFEDGSRLKCDYGTHAENSRRKSR